MDNWHPQEKLDRSSLKKTKALLPKFETLMVSRQRRRKAIRLLKKHGGELQSKLAALLATCSPKHPCESWACDYCMRLARLWWVQTGTALLTPYAEAGICQVTIVPPDAVAPGELHTFDIAAFNKRMRRELRDATKGLVVVGAIDFSANEHAAKKWASHWKPHLHFLVGGTDANNLTKKLEVIHRAEGDAMHHLVHVKAVTYLSSALTYCLKSTFVRRITIDPTGEYAEGKKRKSAKTLKPFLKSHQLADLLPVLHQAGFDDRAILCRVRQQGNFLVKMMGAAPM